MFTVVKPKLSRHFPGRGGLVGGHAGPIENGAPEALPLVNLIQGNFVCTQWLSACDIFFYHTEHDLGYCTQALHFVRVPRATSARAFGASKPTFSEKA